MNVYIVDDDAPLRAAISSLLRSVGLRVIDFGSVPQFLAHPREEAPSCLLLDVRLQGISGLEFQAELNRDGVALPIVFMSGHGDIPMSVRAMKAGALDFLAKPFRDQDLIDAVNAALEVDRARREAGRRSTPCKPATGRSRRANGKSWAWPPAA